MQELKDKIQQAEEILGDTLAEIIADELNVENFDNRNLRCCCPKHNENTPSCVYNKKKHNFHCFGCNTSFDYIDVMTSKGCTFIEACIKLFDLAGLSYSFPEANVKTKHKYRYPILNKVEDKTQMYEYLNLRKISQQTINHVGLEQDGKGNIIFPYYDTNDVLTNVKYRPARKVQKGENKMWFQKDADTTPLLFNMNKINITQPLLICEGEIDCLSAIESGFTNATSVPFGSSNYGWIEQNWDWLEQFNSVIVCPDNDEAGDKMRKESVSRLGSWRTKVVEVPRYIEEEIDGDKVKTRISDLNETLYRFGKEKVLDIINNAVDQEIDGICDFSDVTNINTDDLDGIYSGIPLLDRALNKFFYGTVTILTGINGSGKSSLLNMVIAHSVEQDKNVMLYSGELPNFQTKNWLNFILAGQRNISQYQGQYNVFYKVNRDASKAIDDYYRGKIYFYKDSYEQKVEIIEKVMEETVRKHGVKLIILDNMTSINLGNDDKNKFLKQEEFARFLIMFARKFNIAIVLVCHPHKLQEMRRLTKMDVQGSSSIIDLAHRIISLYRVTPKEKMGEMDDSGRKTNKKPIPYDVICDILKDRMTGNENASFGLFYDKPSKRFYTTEKELDFQYSWDENDYSGVPLPYPPQVFLNEEIANKEVFGFLQK